MVAIRYGRSHKQRRIKSPGKFNIQVRDLNEFNISAFEEIGPAFDEVNELAPWGTPVGITVLATDADANSGRIEDATVDTFGNQVFDRGPFKVDPDSGIVSVDDEQQLQALGRDNQILNIRARSQDGSARTETFTIFVMKTPKWRQNPQGSRREANYPNVDPMN